MAAHSNCRKHESQQESLQQVSHDDLQGAQARRQGRAQSATALVAAIVARGARPRRAAPAAVRRASLMPPGAIGPQDAGNFRMGRTNRNIPTRKSPWAMQGR